MPVIQELFFYVVVLFANAIQAATGFAGTMLAMVPAMQLIGADAAKPLLAALGFAVCVEVTLRAWRKIDWRILLRMSACMLAGLLKHRVPIRTRFARRGSRPLQPPAAL